MLFRRRWPLLVISAILITTFARASNALADDPSMDIQVLDLVDKVEIAVGSSTDLGVVDISIDLADEYWNSQGEALDDGTVWLDDSATIGEPVVVLLEEIYLGTNGERVQDGSDSQARACGGIVSRLIFLPTHLTFGGTFSVQVCVTNTNTVFNEDYVINLTLFVPSAGTITTTINSPNHPDETEKCWSWGPHFVNKCGNWTIGADLWEDGTVLCDSLTKFTDASCGDDGNFCTTTASCSSGGCNYGGNPCSGSRPYCDEANDECDECQLDSHCPDQECRNGVCNNGTCGFSNKPSGSSCGSSSSSGCDARDTCNGSGSCVDRVDPSGTQCRSGNGTCDPPESCNGSSKSCPGNQFASNGTSCGSSSNSGCDAPDSCNGSGSCIDRVDPSGTQCRSGNGTCDPAESCNGSSKSCPGNQFAASGTACGSSSSSGCDAADTCDGSGSCTDNVKPNGTSCPDDGEECTDDRCNGSSKTCQHPNKSSGTSCGSSSSSGCDAADTCSGSGSCTDNVKPNGTSCPDDGEECTDDQCDGSSKACQHPNKSSGAVCGNSSSSECDAADTCDGSGSCDTNQKAAGTACTSDGNDCTDDICDGSGGCTHPSVSDPDCCPAGNGCCVNDDCSDEDPCTNDICTGDTCSNPPNSDACDDGDSCTENDVCAGGNCAGTQISGCGPCNGDSDCATGKFCVSGDCVECRDDNDCDAGSFCDGSENCNNGACVPGTPACSGGDCCEVSEECEKCPCTTDDDCNPGEFCIDDECHQCRDDEDCDDEKFCTGIESCSDGTCSSAGDPCAPNETCDEIENICKPDPNPNARPCEECGFELLCDDNYSCINGICMRDSCENDDQCCPNQSCDNGKCTDDDNSCTVTDDCVNGKICVDDQCVENKTCGPCGSTANCPEDSICLNNICMANTCNNDSDCCGDESCVDKICVPCIQMSEPGMCGDCGPGVCVASIAILFGWVGLHFVGPARRSRGRRAK